MRDADTKHTADIELLRLVIDIAYGRSTEILPTLNGVAAALARLVAAAERTATLEAQNQELLAALLNNTRPLRDVAAELDALEAGEAERDAALAALREAQA